jgi:ABC-type lipoprotein release transport system permease subunit
VVRGLTLIYGFKRVVRSWKLFVALLLGVVLASTFFAGINIGADTAAKQTLDQQLSEVPADVVLAGWGTVWSSDTASEVANLVSSVEGVAETEVISRTDEWWGMQLPDTNETAYFEVVGVSEDSHIYDDLTMKEGAPSLGANETYVWVDASPDVGDLKIGDVLQANFSVWLGGDFEPREPQLKWITLNLTVAGFVELDNKAIRIVLGDYFYGGGYVIVSERADALGRNILIADWNKTFAGLLDAVYASSPPHSPIKTDILAYLDRKSLISPWDPDGSITRVEDVVSQIENEVSSHGFYGLNVINRLEDVLYNFRNASTFMTFGFLVTALPVFFVAWYMGTTVSDVSLNLRRREIGLLLTKGFSGGQLLRMFLAEATLIGLMGGVIGIGLSLLLNPFFVMVTGGELTGAPAIGPYTIVFALIFSVGVTFLSVFQPAKRASKLAAVDALREYRYVEEVKPHKKREPWVAFILGAYKLVVLFLGINPLALTMGRPPSNVLLMILLVTWIATDYILNFVGPILFFWGFTKIFIGRSLKFQELVTKAAKFLGDLGSLATRNVQRNPARAASIAFLIALIIGYSFQAVGAFASAQDRMPREIYFNVGADISVSLASTANISKTMSEIGGISDVLSTTVEYSFFGGSSWGSTEIKAVNPETWLNTAYYEDEWFIGNTVRDAFQSMSLDNNTIVLDRGLTPDLDVGDSIAVHPFQNGFAEPCTLRIVGFFGTEQPQGLLPTEERRSVRYWSYVSEGFYNQVSNNVSAYPKILVKLKAETNGEAVADQIRQLDSDIYSVSSVAEKLEEQQTDVTLSVQRLGVAFAIIVASVGTALVTLVSLKERSKEVSLMSVRGLSFKQLATVLLTDNLAVVLFAVLLGAVGGLIIVRGTVATNNSMAMASPMPNSIVAYHVVFPVDSLIILLACLVLVFASTIIPVIVMAKRYVSRLERMVREA